MPAIGYSVNRRFSIFSDFSKKIRGEAESNPEFQRTVKELKEKAEEIKGVKEDLKVKTKEKTEKLYKQVDGVWTEAESESQVYSFIGSVFDPYASNHLQKLKKMDPIDVETVQLLMRNLSILSRPDFEDHVSILQLASETLDGLESSKIEEMRWSWFRSEGIWIVDCEGLLVVD